MHANVRRLHSSSGAATNRARALRLAAACGDPRWGRSIAIAALGDHPWRKLYGADSEEAGRTPGWATGPRQAVRDLLRLTGRSGPRGRVPAARDDAHARAAVREGRERRAAAHALAVAEVIGAQPGTVLSEPAARVALASLRAAVRTEANGRVRSAVSDGLACTVCSAVDHGIEGAASPAVRAVNWQVLVPGREVAFHAPGTASGLYVPEGTGADESARPVLVLEAIA
jgi:hypothetical protein